VLYVHIIKDLYGLTISAMLFYNKLKNNPCLANKIVNGNKMTIFLDVDDLKVSHKDSKAIDEFIDWVCKSFGLEENVPRFMSILARSKTTQKRKFIIYMVKCVRSMVKSFPEIDLH